jgi:hypothetical protein
MIQDLTPETQTPETHAVMEVTGNRQVGETRYSAPM